MIKTETNKKVKKETKETASNPLLERYIQKTITDRMRQVSDEVLANAIKTLLYEGDKKNKHLN